jgi:hypothetical protein
MNFVRRSPHLSCPRPSSTSSSPRPSCPRTCLKPLAAPLLCLLPLGLALLTGCHSKPAAPAPDDATLTHALQNRIATEAAISAEPIHISVQSAVATLDGSVSTDAARSLASNDAAQVPGIRTVVNNLVVQPAANPTLVSVPPPPPEKPKADQHKPSALVPQPSVPPPPPSQPAPEDPEQLQPPAPAGPIQGIAQNRAQPALGAQPALIVRPTPPPPAPPPPAPPHAAHVITLPATTILPIRIDVSLDSATAKVDDTFTGVIAADIILDDVTVLRQGTPIDGRVSAAQDAAHFSGNSLLTVEINHIDRPGERIAIVTDSFSKTGAGRGKDTAKKTGVGAAVGAVLGGVFGGGKGALIGAATGAGTGAATNALSRGDQVQIPAESLLRFHLTTAITVQAPRGSPEHHDDNGMSQHTN